METTPLTSPNPLTVPTDTVAKAARATIASDFETFLRMMTVQLQNQDPLNPIDSADYAVQLATFSGVEQQVQTNELLKNLAASLGAGGLSEMAGWVGMEARVTGPAHFSGTPLTITPTLEPIVDQAQLVVRNANGTEVQRLDIGTSGDPVTWAGVASDGTPFPPGTYTFQTASYSQGRPQGLSTSPVYRRVTEVQVEDGGTVLVVDGGDKVKATDVTALRDPAL